MPRRTSPIARVPLARSTFGIMVGPVVVAAAGVAGLVGAIVAGGFAALGLVIVGAPLIALAIFGAAALTSVRLEVHEAEMRLSWLGGQRVYRLVRGSVTRVALRGPRASPLRPGLGALGWAFGPARLRDSERIEVIRLQRTRTVILVPTDRGRLAVAPASEDQLLAALTRAARARQRQESVAQQADSTAPEVEEPSVTAERRAPEPATDPEVLAAAVSADARVGRRARLRRGLSRLAPLRPGLRAIVILLPAALAAGTWAVLDGRDMLPAGAAESRLLVVALVLAGPAALLGGIMARLWWSRLVAVVVLVGLASLVIIARALLGGGD